MTNHDYDYDTSMQQFRLKHIQQICQNCLDRDHPHSDRYWLAQSIINIINGNIDWQSNDES